MSEVAEKAVRVRSPAYPSMGLPEAIEKVTVIYKKEGQGRHPIPAISIAKGWDYSSLNGSALSAISALKQFGLLAEKEVENGKSRLLGLTSDAIQLVVRSRDSVEWKSLVRRVALQPKLYQRLWTKYGWPLPSDDTLRTHLLLDESYNSKFIAGIIRDYKATIELAELDFSDKIPDADESQAANGETFGIEKGDWIQWVSQGVAQFSEQRKVIGFSDDGEFVFVAESPTGIPKGQAVRVDPPPRKAEMLDNANTGQAGGRAAKPAPVNPNFQPPAPPSGSKQDVFTTDNGEVVVRWPAVLSVDDLADIEDWLDMLKRKIKRSVKTDGGAEQN